MAKCKFRVRDLNTNKVIGYEVIDTNEAFHYYAKDVLKTDGNEKILKSYKGVFANSDDLSVQRELWTGWNNDFAGGPSKIGLYEGDFVKSPKHNQIYEIRWCDYTSTWYIGFVSQINKKFINCLNLTTALIHREVKYYGNKFENPELLEGNNNG
jgi:hypothetical protein